jgi:hypothetical protein
MYGSLLNLIIMMLALFFAMLSIATALFFKNKYHKQSLRLIDCVLANNFMTKLLNEIACQSSKKSNFANLLENIKTFFQFQEVSVHEINCNTVIHIAGDSEAIDATEHLEKNLSIVHATIKSNSHYCAILDDKNSHMYVIPINGLNTKMILAAKTNQENSLTKIDMEILTKGIKRILEICDALDRK